MNKFMLKKKLTPDSNKISVLKTSLISSLLFTLPFLLLTVSSSPVHAELSGLNKVTNKHKNLGLVVGAAATLTAYFYYGCTTSCNNNAATTEIPKKRTQGSRYSSCIKLIDAEHVCSNRRSKSVSIS